jgi:Leucine-rich repeat (LRR) protein
MVCFCRQLTSLSISNKRFQRLPALPSNLQQLDVSGCSNLLELPVMPQTLRELTCISCFKLKALPSSLSSTAVAKLVCTGCRQLESLPQLPSSLVELQLYACCNMQHLQGLPDGLNDLDVTNCSQLKVSNMVIGGVDVNSYSASVETAWNRHSK